MTGNVISAEAERHSEFAFNFARLADGVTDWSAPTPVKEWQVHDIIEHLLTWLPPVLDAWAEITLADKPGADLPSRWRGRSDEVQEVLNDPPCAHREVTAGPFAGRTVAQTIDAVYTSDVYMHTWDLARSTGQHPQLDPHFAAGLLQGLRGMGEALRSSGQYGEEQPTTSEAPVDRLVAFIGRDPQWRP